MAVSGVETNTVQLILVQPCLLDANIAGKQAIFRVCMKKRLKQVNEIAQSPDYKGQDIYPQVDDEEDTDYYGDSDEGSEPITVVLDTITSEKTVDVVSSYPERIITTVKINDTRSVPMKVDTGADTCVLTTDVLQRLGLCLDIKPCNAVLKSYGGNTITNLGTSTLEITFKSNSASASFNIVKADSDPSIIDIITEVTEPTDWVNSIVCNVKETSDGRKKVRLCLDPKDLNKNIRREHYYSSNIDEIFSPLSTRQKATGT